MFMTIKDLKTTLTSASKLADEKSHDFALSRVKYAVSDYLQALDAIMYDPKRLNICKQVDSSETYLSNLKSTFDENSDEVKAQEEAVALLEVFAEQHQVAYAEYSKFYRETFGETWVPWRERRTVATTKTSDRFRPAIA